MNTFLQFQTKEGKKRIVRLDLITQISESADGTALVYRAGQSLPTATNTDYAEMVNSMLHGLQSLTKSQAERIEQKVDSIIKYLEQPIRANVRLSEDQQRDITDVRNANPL